MQCIYTNTCGIKYSDYLIDFLIKNKFFIENFKPY